MGKSAPARKIARNVGYNTAYSGFFFGTTFLSLFSKKIRQSLQERLKKSFQTPKEVDYWVHIASSGEFEESIPILEKIKEQAPGSVILLTFFSISGKKAIQLETKRQKERQLPWDYVTVLPFDFSWSLDRFLEKWKPKKLVLLDQEIWPMVLWKSKDKNIPIFLFNFKPSAKISWLKKTFLNFELKKINAIGATTEKPFWCSYEGTYKVLGNLRNERILGRAKKATINRLPSLWSKPVIVLASLWEADWEMLQPAVRSFLNDFHFVFVPHEIGALSESIGSSLEAWKVPFQKFTTATQDFSEHLLVDTVGVLFELYSLASFAFVGGSFKAKVHNVVEPCAFGLPIMTGPHIQNSLEALNLQKQGGAVVVNTTEEIKNVFREFKENPGIYQAKGQANKQSVLQENISEAYYQMLMKS